MEAFGATITIIHLVITAITVLFGWILVDKPRKPLDGSGYVLQVIYNILIAAVLVFAYLKGQTSFTNDLSYVEKLGEH